MRCPNTMYQHLRSMEFTSWVPVMMAFYAVRVEVEFTDYHYNYAVKRGIVFC